MGQGCYGSRHAVGRNAVGVVVPRVRRPYAHEVAGEDLHDHGEERLWGERWLSGTQALGLRWTLRHALRQALRMRSSGGGGGGSGGGAWARGRPGAGSLPLCESTCEAMKAIGASCGDLGGKHRWGATG